MRSFSKFIRQPAPLLTALIVTGLLIAACSGSAKPPVTDAAEAPIASESESIPAEEPTATPAKASPEPTAAAANSEAESGEPDPTSTTGPAAAIPAQPTRKPASTYADLEVITLLPRDAIPAIDNPRFLSAAEADEFYDPDELVMGVSFNGESRAYSAPFLSNHEIVNDTVGGVKLAVTW